MSELFWRIRGVETDWNNSLKAAGHATIRVELWSGPTHSLQFLEDAVAQLKSFTVMVLLTLL